MTELVVMDELSARRLTERIRLVASNVAENVEKLRQLVAEARDGNVHEVLGYPSWTAYLKEVFGDEPLRLARDVRQELVAELSAQGMSTRAIAPVVGVAHKTIARDLSAVSNDTPVATEDNIWVEPNTGEVVEPQTMMQLNPNTGIPEDVPARHVTGLDGKEYAVAVQKKPNRRALTDVAKDAGWDIRKAAERLERIRDDDRYARNKNEVSIHLRSHLIYVIETCQGVLDDLTKKEEDQ